MARIERFLRNDAVSGPPFVFVHHLLQLDRDAAGFFAGDAEHHQRDDVLRRPVVDRVAEEIVGIEDGGLVPEYPVVALQEMFQE